MHVTAWTCVPWSWVINLITWYWWKERKEVLRDSRCSHQGCHDIGLSNSDTLRNHKIPDFLLGGKYKGCVFRTTASELIYFLTTAGGMGGGGTAWALQRRRVCQRSVGDEGEKRRGSFVAVCQSCVTWGSTRWLYWPLLFQSRRIVTLQLVLFQGWFLENKETNNDIWNRCSFAANT